MGFSLSKVFSAVGNLQNAINGTTSNNKFNAQQAQISRDWQEELANTAHQREVEDLRAAGLNPILSAGGSGAAVPNGSAASATPGNGAGLTDIALAASGATQQFAAAELATQQAQQSAAETDFTKGVKSDKARKEIEQMQTQMKVNSAQVGLMNSQAQLNNAETEYTKGAKTENTKQNTWESLGRQEKNFWENKLNKKDYYNYHGNRLGLNSAKTVYHIFSKR